MCVVLVFVLVGLTVVFPSICVDGGYAFGNHDCKSLWEFQSAVSRRLQLEKTHCAEQESTVEVVRLARGPRRGGRWGGETYVE